MNEEKDRFGDFIRLLERARDVYFAEKDRELIETLKRRLEKAQQGQLENPTMKCPTCGVNLHNASLIDFPVSRCSSCGGIWLNRGVLRQFMDMKTIETPTERQSSTDSLRNVWRTGLRGVRGSHGNPRKEETKPTSWE
jgi:Zn-finger nucleic acid-binding protein